MVRFLNKGHGTHQQYPPPSSSSSSSCLVGSCLGLLAATAVACSQNVLDLVSIGPEVVVLAFRTGLLVQERTETVAPTPSSSSSSSSSSSPATTTTTTTATATPAPYYYSALLTAIDRHTATSLVDAYGDAEALPARSRPYVSAVVGHANGVTVSGPPSLLRAFLLRARAHDNEDNNNNNKTVPVPVAGLFHAPHLYTAHDVATLCDGLSTALQRRVVRQPIVSNSTLFATTTTSSSLSFPSSSEEEEKEEGKGDHDGDALLQGTTAVDMFRAALSEILRGQLRWDLTVDRAVDVVRRSGCARALVVPCAAGSSQHSLTNALLRALPATAAGGVRSVEAQQDRTTTTPSSSSSSSSDSRDSGPTKHPRRTEIAIIGFSGRFPEADTNDEFWALLAAGRDVHREIPADRCFDPWRYYDATGKRKNTSAVTKGNFLRRPDLFDARFFGLSPREAEQADPAQRLALLTAYEAMEMAGFVPDGSPATQRDRVGVFYGTASDDYRETNAAQQIGTYFVPGGSRAFLPARINYHFRFSGPSFDVDTACSSGLAAVHLACNALWAGDCDVAVTGGTNVLTNPDNWAGLDRAHFLSHTGNCQTFDDAADGYCRAESVATVLLKRREDAELDGDPIFATILGAYTNHSAEAVSMTRPHSGAQRAIFRRILDGAGVAPAEVSYVEMHGTGTQHGDACEMDSVLSVFAPEGSRRDASSGPQAAAPRLHLGSAKANIGHGESASGISSLIKVLLMMEKSQIPPHVGIKTKINRNFPPLTELAQRGVHIALETQPWTRPPLGSHPTGRLAFVNNFGAAGGNSSVLVQDAPAARVGYRDVLEEEEDDDDQDPRPVHIVTVSAKTQTSLKANIRALGAHLEDHPRLPLASLSYTTTARRVHYALRLAVTGTTVDEIRAALRAAEATESFPSSSMNAAGTGRGGGGGGGVGFCFTGQGAQYLGMGQELLGTIPQLRATVTALDDIIRAQGWASCLSVLDGSCPTPLEDLPPATVQLALVCLQMALAKFWVTLGIQPRVVVGHSLGEYAAMNAAGILSDADTLHLVGSRALLLEKHCSVGSHGMLAVKASLTRVLSLVASRPGLEIACVNGPEEVVVAGPNDEVDALLQSLSSTTAIKATLLKVPFAFHSAQVEPMLAAFRATCRGIVFNDPAVPLLSPLRKEVVTKASQFGAPATYLSEHCRRTVHFAETLQSAQAAGTITDKLPWLEIGPHAVCANMIRATLGPSTRTHASLLRRESGCKVLTSTLSALYMAGAHVHWAEYHSDFRKNLHVVRLPAYQWDLRSFWIPYVHDWCLTKGDAPPPPPPPATLALAAAAAAVASPPPPPKILTASVQHIVDERHGADESWITARSDVQYPDLAVVLKSHRVNGRPVCSSAVYADMALTLFGRCLERCAGLTDKADYGIDVTHMAADKSLILNEDGPTPQLIEMKAHVTWSTMSASFSMYSLSTEGKAAASHAKCQGAFQKKSEWTAGWKRRDYLVTSRIESLQKAVHDEAESVHLIKTGMFYKLFGALVEYGDAFKACRELIIRSADLESTARVRFNTDTAVQDQFVCPPYWMDGLGQITGFTLNGNDTLDSASQVFINHGWQSMKIARPLSPDQEYRTYLKFHKAGDSVYTGDVYIFHHDTLEMVALYEGVTFATVPRKILDKVLPPAGAGQKQPTLAVDNKAVDPVPAVAASGPPVSSSQVEEALVTLGLGPAAPPSSAEPLVLAPSGEESRLAAAETMRRIISEEVGVPLDEVKDDEELVALGVDSLLSLTMSDRILEELHVKVDTAAFMTGLKVSDLIVLVSGKPTEASSSSSSSSSPSSSSSSSSSSLASYTSPTSSDVVAVGDKEAAPASFSSRKDEEEGGSWVPVPVPSPPAHMARATSVLLQGEPRTASIRLWLFPDGSGVATSYLALPDIDAQRVVVYGLSSPFVRRSRQDKDVGEDMARCTFAELTAAYLAEVRRRQPQGPYYLGGWSAGGLSAYEAAQQLAAAGEEVGRLVLLDAPRPIGLAKLPARLYDAFDAHGVFGQGQSSLTSTSTSTPSWLLPHMLGFLSILDSYRPQAWRGRRALATWVLWAARGVSEDGSIAVRPEDPPNVAWLLRRRTQADLGFHGWDQLVGRENVTVEVLPGANHFTMLTRGESWVADVSSFLARALNTAQ